MVSQKEIIEQQNRLIDTLQQKLAVADERIENLQAINTAHEAQNALLENHIQFLDKQLNKLTGITA